MNGLGIESAHAVVKNEKGAVTLTLMSQNALEATFVNGVNSGFGSGSSKSGRSSASKDGAAADAEATANASKSSVGSKPKIPPPSKPIASGTIGIPAATSSS